MTHENEASERQLDEEADEPLTIDHGLAASAIEQAEAAIRGNHPVLIAARAFVDPTGGAVSSGRARRQLLLLCKVGKDGTDQSPTPLAKGETMQVQLTAQRRTLPERLVVGAELNDLVFVLAVRQFALEALTHDWLDVGGTFTVTVRAAKDIENVRIMVSAYVEEPGT